jgi:hypothetical protein
MSVGSLDGNRSLPGRVMIPQPHCCVPDDGDAGIINERLAAFTMAGICQGDVRAAEQL